MLFSIKHSSFIAIFVTILATLYYPSAFASSGAHLKIQPILSTGISYGGQELIEIEFNDISHTSTETVEAGGLFQLGLGIITHIDNSLVEQIELQTSINYFGDNVFASNGTVSFQRFPVDAILFYTTNRHRFGAGLTRHFSPRYHLDSDNTEYVVEMNDATGTVLEYNYKLKPWALLGLRRVDINYDFTWRGQKQTIEGSHWAAMLHLKF